MRQLSFKPPPCLLRRFYALSVFFHVERQVVNAFPRKRWCNHMLNWTPRVPVLGSLLLRGLGLTRMTCTPVVSLSLAVPQTVAAFHCGARVRCHCRPCVIYGGRSRNGI